MPVTGRVRARGSSWCGACWRRRDLVRHRGTSRRKRKGSRKTRERFLLYRRWQGEVSHRHNGGVREVLRSCFVRVETLRACGCRQGWREHGSIVPGPRRRADQGRRYRCGRERCFRVCVVGALGRHHGCVLVVVHEDLQRRRRRAISKQRWNAEPAPRQFDIDGLIHGLSRTCTSGR